MSSQNDPFMHKNVDMVLRNEHLRTLGLCNLDKAMLITCSLILFAQGFIFLYSVRIFAAFLHIFSPFCTSTRVFVLIPKSPT